MTYECRTATELIESLAIAEEEDEIVVVTDAARFQLQVRDEQLVSVFPENH